MRHAIILAAVLSCTSMCSLAADAGQPSFVITGPTIVAFFPLANPSAIDEDGNEALADFQFYAGNVRTPLADVGIEFHETYALSFQIRVGKKIRTFRPHNDEVGYYFIAPGKEPRINYGVMTDVDLLQAAKEYSGTRSSR